MPVSPACAAPAPRHVARVCVTGFTCQDHGFSSNLRHTPGACICAALAPAPGRLCTQSQHVSAYLTPAHNQGHRADQMGSTVGPPTPTGRRGGGGGVAVTHTQLQSRPRREAFRCGRTVVALLEREEAEVPAALAAQSAPVEQPQRAGFSRRPVCRCHTKPSPRLGARAVPLPPAACPLVRRTRAGL